MPETLDGLFVNHAHMVDDFSAETFVLLLYRGRNLRGFLRVVADRADLLPIEIFRSCVQEAKLSSWPPEAHIEDSEHPHRGHFQELRSCKSLDMEHVDAQAFDAQRVLRAQ